LNTTKNTFNYKYYLTLTLCLVYSVFSFGQNNGTEQDSTQTGHSLGSLQLPNPSSIVSKYTYDPITQRYIYTESLGDFDINYPIILTPEEYQKLVEAESLKQYYKDKVAAFDGKLEDENAQKNLVYCKKSKPSYL